MDIQVIVTEDILMDILMDIRNEEEEDILMDILPWCRPIEVRSSDRADDYSAE